ncbi:MAG: capsid cement protein [Nostoc sp.]|uniref:capsid cement protein n=1 Tax=Nostoc sp. TaxID=1180 RepID=UPI002FF1FF54
MALTAFQVASKSIDDHSLKALTLISVGVAVDYAGNQISSLGVPVLGIATSDVTIIGEYFGVAVLGTTVARTGAAIALGDPLKFDALGQVIKAKGGETAFARAKQSATAAGQFIEVFITREPHQNDVVTASGVIGANLAVDYTGAQVATAGVAVYGIARYAALAASPVAIAISGTTVAVIGGTVAIGDPLTPNASGQLITATTTGQFIFARSKVAGTTGNTIEILITREGKF